MKQSEKELDSKKKEIQSIALDKIKEYFGIDKGEMENLSGDQLKHFYNMAKIGMQFEKEMNVAKRASEMNYLRVGKLVTENKEELKRYLKRTLPQYN